MLVIMPPHLQGIQRPAGLFSRFDKKLRPFRLAAQPLPCALVAMAASSCLFGIPDAISELGNTSATLSCAR